MFVSDYWTEWGCPPDIIGMAKSIAGGIPLGAVTAGESIYAKVKPGTFGGNPLACAAAIKVLEIMKRDRLPERADSIAERCRAVFKSWQKDISAIGDVRGIGCMMGIEFIKNADKTPWAELVAETVREAAQHGLLIESSGTFGNVIRFLCPLIVTDAQIEAVLAILKNAIAASIAKLA
jgi:4-aminobutyrate aminotransferase/(S)-3-amino-2-methylpropionate transaminase